MSPQKTPASIPRDRVKLTPLQAERLAAVSDVSAKELTGLSVVDISEKFRYQLDPMLLAFRKICGVVVKKDPVTGVEYPVPYATVHVEDTDCSLLGYFPPNAPWGWYFPFRCRREVIATAKTDACGRFCVWIPRWDIDWVLRFRRERVCFPIIFERPSVRDLLDRLIPERIPFPFPEPGPIGPRPGPDPSPIATLDARRLVQQIEDQIGRKVFAAADVLEGRAVAGSRAEALTDALDAPAFDQPIPPPLPAELRITADKRSAKALNIDGVRSTLAARMKFDAAEFADLDLRKYIGPFKRCFDVFIPEWMPIVDVPDITFRVTQDTDLDGDEEDIYSEGYFQVRWNAGSIGPVKIVANPNARAGLLCGGDPVPCADEPAIVLAGRMPVVNVPAIYDAAAGYALRPNRPHPSGAYSDPLPNPAAASPFMGAVALYGCNRTDPSATHYRLVYKYSHDGGVTFTTETPFVGLTWPLFRLDGAGNPEWHYPTADANGWYPIALPAGPNPFLPQDLLLDWPTYAFANGRYVVKLEIGTPAGATSSSDEVAFNIDNAAPAGPLSVEWRKGSVGAFQPLGALCPVVKRGASPVDLEFRVTLLAAATHLRYAAIGKSGCGVGSFTVVGGTEQHWHVSTTDNAETLEVVYRLPASAQQGTYSFGGHVSSRAFNPSGGDGGHLVVPAWEYDPAPIQINPSFSFSVIDVN